MFSDIYILLHNHFLSGYIHQISIPAGSIRFAVALLWKRASRSLRPTAFIRMVWITAVLVKTTITFFRALNNAIATERLWWQFETVHLAILLIQYSANHLEYKHNTFFSYKTVFISLLISVTKAQNCPLEPNSKYDDLQVQCNKFSVNSKINDRLSITNMNKTKYGISDCMYRDTS